MATIDLPPELRHIEAAIDSGDRMAASTALDAAAPRFGRRPDFRYVRCLFDATFGVRGPAELAAEVIALAGEQPDFFEAVALAAELCHRVGDAARAKVFARMASESANPSARDRAARVLSAFNEDAPVPSRSPSSGGMPRVRPPSVVMQAPSRPASIAMMQPASRPASIAMYAPSAPIQPRSPGSSPFSKSPSAAPAPFAPSPSVAPGPRSEAISPGPSPMQPPRKPTVAFGAVNPTSSRYIVLPGGDEMTTSATQRALTEPEPEDWFSKARREQVQRRTPMHGVRAVTSTVETLLDLARAVAAGKTALARVPLALDRSGLAVVDGAILEWRKARPATGSRRDYGETMAAAAFLLATVLHELGGEAVETTAEDGGCRVVLPGGVGIRPILIATAYARGTGASLLDAYDRLAHARELDPTPSAAMSRRGSSMGMAAVRPEAQTQPLALTRAQVEAAPLRIFDLRPPPGPALRADLTGPLATFAASTMGQEIALRAGLMALSPTHAGVDAIEAFCKLSRDTLHIGSELAEEEERMVVLFGAFLGEMLISTFGGHWEEDPADPDDLLLLRVVCRDRLYAWPMIQVLLRLRDGDRHDLVGFVSSAGRMLR